MTLIGNRAFTDVISLNSAGLAWALSSSTGVFTRRKSRHGYTGRELWEDRQILERWDFPKSRNARYCQQLLIAWRKTWERILLQSHILISNFQPAKQEEYICYVKPPSETVSCKQVDKSGVPKEDKGVWGS